jgi:hypothetical protein
MCVSIKTMWACLSESCGTRKGCREEKKGAFSRHAPGKVLLAAGRVAGVGPGAAPDIEVLDAPDALARGEDPALERGVKYLLDQLAKNPRKKLVVPPIPTGGNPQ